MADIFKHLTTTDFIKTNQRKLELENKLKVNEIYNRLDSCQTEEEKQRLYNEMAEHTELSEWQEYLETAKRAKQAREDFFLLVIESWTKDGFFKKIKNRVIRWIKGTWERIIWQGRDYVIGRR